MSRLLGKFLGVKRFRSLCCVQRQLTKVPAAQAIALMAIHEPEMRQRGNPYRGKVLKRFRGNGFINFQYQTTARKPGSTSDVGWQMLMAGVWLMPMWQFSKRAHDYC